MATNPYPGNWPRFVAERLARAADVLPADQVKRIEALDAFEASVRAMIVALANDAKVEAEKYRVTAAEAAASIPRKRRKDTRAWARETFANAEREVTARSIVHQRLLALLDDPNGTENDSCWGERIWEVAP